MSSSPTDAAASTAAPTLTKEERRAQVVAAVAAARLKKQQAKEAAGQNTKRSVNMADIFGDAEQVDPFAAAKQRANYKGKSGQGNKGKDRIEDFRMQVEHGPKKFIKP
jgi:hypothetical protein